MTEPLQEEVGGGHASLLDSPIWFTLLVVCAALCVTVAYQLGKNSAKAPAAYGWKGTFVTSLLALEQFDSGRQEQALKTVRNHLYASALTLLQDPSAREDGTVTNLVPDLKRYLVRHSSTNESDVTPVERRLRELLRVDQESIGGFH